ERRTGLGRAIVSDRLSTLFELRLLEEGDLAPASGGRAPRLIRFREEAAIILLGALDQTRIAVGIADLSGKPLAEHHEAADLSAADPVVTAKRLCTLLDWMIEQHGRGRPIWGIGLAAPGPVEDGWVDDFPSPRMHFMPAWDDYPIAQHLQARYRAPI